MLLRLAPLINNLQPSPTCTGAATVIGIGHTVITGIALIGATTATIGHTVITGTVLTGAAGMDTGHTATMVIGAVLIGGVTAIGVTGAAGDGSPILRLRFYQRRGVE
jgi:hypothetical protein